MKIKCGNCGRSHESVDAVKACYDQGLAVPRTDPSRPNISGQRTALAERAEERKSFATKNTLGGSSSGRMATDKMVRFVLNLARDREMSAGTAHEAVTKADDGSMTFDYARQFIDSYKDAPAKVTRSRTGASAVSEDGMYRNLDTGVIYKVQYNKGQGDGRRLYAKRLILEGVPKGETRLQLNLTPGTEVEEGTAKVRFVYASGAIRQLRPDWKMTADEARAFGALYGSCVNCGRDLTRESSIAHGYGETCAGNLGWPYDPQAVPV